MLFQERKTTHGRTPIHLALIAYSDAATVVPGQIPDAGPALAAAKPVASPEFDVNAGTSLAPWKWDIGAGVLTVCLWVRVVADFPEMTARQILAKFFAASVVSRSTIHSRRFLARRADLLTD